MNSSLQGLLRLNQVLALIPVSRAQLFKKIKEGVIPSPIHPLGPRLSFWKEEDIAALLKRWRDEAA